MLRKVVTRVANKKTVLEPADESNVFRIKVVNEEIQKLMKEGREQEAYLLEKKGPTYKGVIHYELDKHVPTRKLVRTSTTGMHDAFALAFQNHCPLVLEPHALWILMMQSISKHVALNVEKFRHLFTTSKDKQHLVVIVDDPTQFRQFIDGIANQLESLVKFDPLVEFSTNTTVSNYVAKVTFMDASKSYYNYEMKVLCGIPEFHVMGTKDDWDKFITKAREMGQLFDLKKWTDTIVEVITRIRDCDYAKDSGFWNSAYSLDYGCGGPPGVTGWLLAFMLYDSNDRKQCWSIKSIRKNDQLNDDKSNSYRLSGTRVETDDLQSQIVQVPFIQTLPGGIQINMFMYAGFCGVYQDVDTGAFSPCLGWAVGL